MKSKPTTFKKHFKLPTQTTTKLDEYLVKYIHLNSCLRYTVIGKCEP